MFNWDETGFYRGCTPLKTNSDKKEPIIPYTKESVELQTARGYQSYSGILAYDTALYDADDADYDNTILWKLKEQECIEYFIRIGLQGLKRVVNDKCYSTSAKVDAQLEEYKVANNPILSFIQFCSDEDISIENESFSLVYENYCGYCAKRNYRPLRDNEFSKQIQRCSEYRTKRITIRGKKIQIFIKEGGQA